MSIRKSLLPLTAAAMLALVATGAWAQDRGHRGQQDRGQQDRGDDGDRSRMRDAGALPRPMIAEPREMRRSERNDELADSVRRIERSTRGQVISAERMQSDGRDINRIKVMDDRGRVRVYMDDPQQGRRTPTRDDDN